MRKTLFFTLLILVFSAIILAKIGVNTDKNVEKVLKSVENHLPGKPRPSDVECVDVTYYDYHHNEPIEQFVCYLTDRTIYGILGHIKSVSFRVTSPLVYGDLLDVYGEPRNIYVDRKGTTWIWNDLIARTSHTSINKLFLPIRTLYLHG